MKIRLLHILFNVKKHQWKTARKGGCSFASLQTYLNQVSFQYKSPTAALMHLCRCWTPSSFSSCPYLQHHQRNMEFVRLEPTGRRRVMILFMKMKPKLREGGILLMLKSVLSVTTLCRHVRVNPHLCHNSPSKHQDLSTQADFHYGGWCSWS